MYPLEIQFKNGSFLIQNLIIYGQVGMEYILSLECNIMNYFERFQNGKVKTYRKDSFKNYNLTIKIRNCARGEEK